MIGDQAPFARANKMDLHVQQETIPDGTRRTVKLRNIADRADVELFFDLVGTTAPTPTILDGFVFGVIFFAMRLGQDVQVHGPLSLDALLNLSEFQEAWVSWKPATYRKINILPEKIIEYVSLEGRKRAIAAFSGGVDSIFTILRHNTKRLGNASYPLSESVLMVHGFDVPLDAAPQLEALINRTKPFLDELHLNLQIVRTNLKEAGLQDWEDSFMSQLACCLHNYWHDFRFALVGSSEPYSGLALPWGSNPATDYLLSGSGMRLVHDGAGFSRTEKVAQIRTHKTALKVVKVCWEGQEASKNCGYCEKCIRTRLNFLAVGVSQPPCFEQPFDLDLIATVNLRNDTQLNELVSIFGYAQRHGIKDQWVQILKSRIDRYRNPPRKFRNSFLPILRGAFSKTAAKVHELVAGLAVRFR
jgi:hypothetical protein